MVKKRSKRFFKKSYFMVLVIVTLCLINLFLFLFSQGKLEFPTLTAKTLTSFDGYADEIVSKCRSAPYKPSCYDREIPKLMDKISMEDAFKVTKIVQDKDPEYQYCHVLGHELAAREVSKDPSKWKEVVTRCPSGVCSNGCLHGGFQERFRKESLSDNEIDKILPDITNICEKRSNWNPTSLEQASCYHALGHLVMYMTEADINKSLKLCDKISVKNDGRDFSQLCYDGTFMQIFQPLEPEDVALVKDIQPTKQTLLSFCNRFSGPQRGSCISESWPLFSEEIKTSEGLEKFCSMETPDQKERCYNAIFFVLVPQFNFDTEKIKAFCQSFKNERAAMCFSDFSARLIETDYRNIEKSVAICAYAEAKDVDHLCFNTLLLYSTYNFHQGSKEFYSLCNALPKDWKNKCLNPN